MRFRPRYLLLSSDLPNSYERGRQAPICVSVGGAPKARFTSTVGTLISAGWLPQLIPPSGAASYYARTYRPFKRCASSARGFSLPASVSSAAFHRNPDIKEYRLAYVAIYEIQRCSAMTHASPDREKM